MGIVRTTLSVSFVAITVFASASGAGAPTVERLVSGEATPKGGALVAGDHGARYELKGGAIVDVTPGSEFSFDPSLRVPLGKPGEPDMLTRVVRLARGTVDVTVSGAKRDPTALMVRGPSKMNSVTRAGTATFVAAGESSTAACRVGDTLVGVGNDWKPLKEGFARTLAPENPTAIPRPLVTSPAPSFDRGLLFIRGNEPGSAHATWQPVKEASSYDVRVSRVGEKEKMLVSHQMVSGTSVPLNGLSPETYVVVVASVDKYGLAGAPSESKSLRVAGIEVPNGAEVTSDGAIVLAKDQRVQLLGSEGLEVSYGTSGVFGAAPSTLGLAHNESVVARLRAPGASDETVIRLEPKGLRARVVVGPKAALWPSDRVNITVDLYDASGRAVPENADVKPSVTVNAESVKLDWHRGGHSLRASVPPATTPGPWVIRAEVRDGRGELIGRDFLEVAKTETRGSSSGVANR